MELDQDRLAARLGEIIGGRWRLRSLLGVGGMAAVYGAEDRDGRRAAVKLLHPDMGLRRDIKERFLREAAAATTVGHPGAVSIIDQGQTGDTIYLAMELLEGESLAERVRQRGRLPVVDVLQILDQVLDVLAAAHSRGVVHRDLKPENLFMTTDGRVKVLDFGLARLLDGGANSFRTRTGTALGTLPYMAPEQALGRRDEIDARTDLFAVGATAFRLLSGRRVHDAPSEAELLMAMASRAAPSLLAAAPDLPPDVALVVDRALCFERLARYPNASVMQEDVRAIMRGGRPPHAISRLAVESDVTCPGRAVPRLDVPTQIEPASSGAMAPRGPAPVERPQSLKRTEVMVAVARPFANPVGDARQGGWGRPAPTATDAPAIERGRADSTLSDHPQGAAAGYPAPANAAGLTLPLSQGNARGAPGSVGPGPMGPAPMGPAPMGPAPMGPAPMGPAPMGPAPMGPAPMGPAPMGPAPMGPAPMEPAPMGPGLSGVRGRRLGVALGAGAVLVGGLAAAALWWSPAGPRGTQSRTSAVSANPPGVAPVPVAANVVVVHLSAPGPSAPGLTSAVGAKEAAQLGEGSAFASAEPVAAGGGRGPVGAPVSTVGSIASPLAGGAVPSQVPSAVSSAVGGTVLLPLPSQPVLGATSPSGTVGLPSTIPSVSGLASPPSGASTVPPTAVAHPRPSGSSAVALPGSPGGAAGPSSSTTAPVGSGGAGHGRRGHRPKVPGTSLPPGGR